MRHSMVALGLGVTVLLGGTAEARPQDVSPAFAKDILQLMEVTGALRVGHQMASSMIGQAFKAMRAADPNLPPRAGDVIKEMIEAEFGKAFAPGGEMANIFVTVYAKHFTQDDIRGLITFYESPLGKKVVETLPDVAQESMTLGAQWASVRMPQVMEEIRTRLRAEGVIK